MRRRRLRVLLAMGVLAALVALALSACGGGGGQEANKNKSADGGTAATNGQIVFRRWFDPDHTKAALFAMNPDGSPIHQITHPPQRVARRLPDVVSRWEEGGLPAPEDRREH